MQIREVVCSAGGPCLLVPWPVLSAATWAELLDPWPYSTGLSKSLSIA